MNFKLWIAQGFGVGRIPVAPGTFGSMVGVLWFALLVAAGNFWFLFAGTILGAWLSIWLCDVAEKALGKKDPGSVVLDEICAIPVCYLAWVLLFISKHHAFPTIPDFFGASTWLYSLGIFFAFRIFDVAKPWPARQSQSLPGGWGITVDDLFAAAYVNLVTLLAYFLNNHFAK